jgi:hypothetical protein
MSSKTLVTLLDLNNAILLIVRHLLIYGADGDFASDDEDSVSDNGNCLSGDREHPFPAPGFCST